MADKTVSGGLSVEVATDGSQVAANTGNVASSPVEAPKTMQTSTTIDLDHAMESLLGYLAGSEKEAWRKAAESKDPEKITKVIKPVIDHWIKRTNEREERMATFRGAAIELAHQVFDRRGNRLSAGELTAWILLNAKLDPEFSADYQDALERTLRTEPAVFHVPSPDDADKTIVRLRTADGRDTGEKRQAATAAPARRGRKPGSKNKAASKPRKASGSNADGPARGRFVGVIKKALGVEALTGAQQQAVIANLNGVKVNAATAAQIKAAAKAGGVK